MTPSVRRLGAALVALCVLVGLSACEANAEVGIDVDEDGSGMVAVMVELDGEAVARVGGIEAIDTDDLSEAGWDVADPQLEGDGMLRFRATKAFGSPGELQPTLDEITGPEGPLQDMSVAVLDRFGATGYRLDGRLRTSGDLAQFSDEQVAEVLDGLPLGRTDEQVAEELSDNPGSLTLSVVASLPGELGDTTGEVTSADDDEVTLVTWTADLTAEAADLELVLNSEHRSGNAAKFVVGGAAVLALAALLLAYGLLASRRLSRR